MSNTKITNQNCDVLLIEQFAGYIKIGMFTDQGEHLEDAMRLDAKEIKRLAAVLLVEYSRIAEDLDE